MKVEGCCYIRFERVRVGGFRIGPEQEQAGDYRIHFARAQTGVRRVEGFRNRFAQVLVEGCYNCRKKVLELAQERKDYCKYFGWVQVEDSHSY